eukprot:SM000322S12510  [mRNA]  locus=s322:97374:98997:- [translate_table: standard]
MRPLALPAPLAAPTLSVPPHPRGGWLGPSSATASARPSDARLLVVEPLPSSPPAARLVLEHAVLPVNNQQVASLVNDGNWFSILRSFDAGGLVSYLFSGGVKKVRSCTTVSHFWVMHRFQLELHKEAINSQESRMCAAIQPAATVTSAKQRSNPFTHGLLDVTFLEGA